MKRKIKVLARRLIYLSLGTWYRPNLSRMTVLCYHSISDDGWRYSVSEENFRKQITLLSLEYQFVTLRDLDEWMAGRLSLEKPGIVLTFDDGYRDILSVRNYLKKMGIRPAVFALADREAANRKQLESDKAMLTAEELRELIDEGWEVGCHSMTHADFRQLNKEQRKEEIMAAKERMEREIGIKIKYFAYPKGVYSQNIKRAVRQAGYQMAFSMDDYRFDKKAGRMAIPRIGIDNSHSLMEIKPMISDGSIAFRAWVKNYFPRLAL